MVTKAASTAAGVSLRRVLLDCLAVVGAVAAVIHFAVAGEHFAEFWGFGVFMLGVAWLQVIWAAGLRRWDSRLWLALGGALNGVVVVVYVITRTVGDVIGPTPTDVEPIGFGDALCTAAEVVCVAAVLLLVGLPLRRRLRVEQARGVLVATVVSAMVLLSVALVAGGPEMVMSGGGMG